LRRRKIDFCKLLFVQVPLTQMTENLKRTTCRAIAQVWIKDIPTRFTSYEEIPVSEYENPYLQGHGLTTPTETIWWNRDGTTKRVRKNDTTIWWPKPTLADAVKNKRQGEFWKFNADGSVHVKDADGEWFWSADYQVETPRRSYWGEDGYLYCDEKVWYSDMIPMLKDEHKPKPLRRREEQYDSDDDSCGCGNAYRCCGYDSTDMYSRD
jgi:hypothetical protein